MSLFELHDAVVKRCGKNILEVDEFILHEGESIAILGPNGSGKSTFVNLITREVLPLHRDVPPVLFFNSPNTALFELKMKVGFVSASMQEQISVNLPAKEIVAGGLFGSLGVPKRFKVDEVGWNKVHTTMLELGIGDLADRGMRTLSTGQARRVLIARALVHDPQILVLDEPCTGLDPAGMYHVRKSMSKIIENGKSVVLVTHYPEDVVSEIERVVLIKSGRVVADGAREQLLSNASLSELFEIPYPSTVGIK